MLRSLVGICVGLPLIPARLVVHGLLNTQVERLINKFRQVHVGRAHVKDFVAGQPYEVDEAGPSRLGEIRLREQQHDLR